MNPYIEMLKKVQAEHIEPPATESLSANNAECGIYLMRNSEFGMRNKSRHSDRSGGIPEAKSGKWKVESGIAGRFVPNHIHPCASEARLTPFPNEVRRERGLDFFESSEKKWGFLETVAMNPARRRGQCLKGFFSFQLSATDYHVEGISLLSFQPLRSSINSSK